jgi:hypothetical protein
MKNATLTLRAAAGIAIASLMVDSLAGCSGSSSALPVAAPSATTARTSAQSNDDSIGSGARMDGRSRKPQLLFVGDNQNSRIEVYDATTKKQNPPPMRTITDGIDQPYGITTDESGNLYVANLGDSTVTVYAANSSKPETTITNGLNDPFDVKVDGFGNVYIANNPDGAAPFIQEYAKGASQPSSTWTAPVLGVITGIALLDPMQKGETSIYALEFAAVQSGGTGEVLSCYPGNSTCKSAGYTFGVTGGIAVAESPGKRKPFEFLVADNAIPGVDTFVSGQLVGQLITGGSPEGIALNATDGRLYVASGSSESVVEYSFPGNKVLNTFTPPEANVYGVATTPAGTYH